MITRLIPGSWDIEGRPVSQPRRRHGFRSTFPMGAYLSQPLAVRCGSLEEIRSFLLRCRYVADKDQFGVGDYWMPPEQFERVRQGDCDCFALWAWRQLLHLGYDARYMVGQAGQRGVPHAWVTFRMNGEWHVLEPTAARQGPRLPVLFTLFYRPRMSVGWDGERLHYYEHQEIRYLPPNRLMAGLLAESTFFNVRVWMRKGANLARLAFQRSVRRLA